MAIPESLKLKWEEVRALLGPKGVGISWAELIEEMANQTVVSLKAKKFGKRRVENTPPAECFSPESSSRHIPRSLKYSIWVRDKGRCTQCGSRRHVCFDHVKPFALGGETSLSHLRLLCHSCNHRAAMKTFGVFKPPNKEIESLSP